MHGEHRRAGTRQGGEGLAGARVRGIVVIVAHPGFEEVAEQVKRIGFARRSPEEREEFLRKELTREDRARVIKEMAPEDRLEGLTAEQRLAGLTPEQKAALLARLQQEASPKPE